MYNWQMGFSYSPCSLRIAVDYDSTTRLLKVKAWATALDTFPTANTHLRYAIAESHIFYEWQGLDSVQHVVRKMLPDQNGVAFSIGPGETFVDSQSYSLSSAWVDRNCDVVVFVQADGYPDRSVFCTAQGDLFQTYVLGDANDDGVIDVADVVFLLNYLYRGGDAPVPVERADVNGDEVVDVADVVYLLNYLYRGGSPPL